MKKLILLVLLGATTPIFHASVEAAPESKLLRAPLKWPAFREIRTLKSFDNRVAAIQYLLRARGVYRGKIDGIFGPQTTRAVKAFQKQRGLRVDGVAGPQTLPKLVLTVKQGSRGDAVRAAQILARVATGHNGETPNAGLGVDGTFGAETRKAIQYAQACENDVEQMLLIDGLMGPRSWCLMLGGSIVGSEV